MSLIDKNIMGRDISKGTSFVKSCTDLLNNILLDWNIQPSEIYYYCIPRANRIFHSAGNEIFNIQIYPRVNIFISKFNDMLRVFSFWIILIEKMLLIGYIVLFQNFKR